MLRPLDAHAPYDVGPYRLLAGLGSGGMGTVHLALPPDGGPDDLVALKTVRRDLELEGDFRVRFRREAEAARAVRSPYVSALVDADPDAERPWLATAYVVGPSLDEAVTRTGALSVPVVRELGADLARGLAAVHGARLVHRDLKPANVVLGTGGPRLIDFGIAQAYDATALTATGIMVGSPGFMSPEHVAGDRSVTARSDVFCLGAVLCFAATGRGPFQDSELAAIVHRIAQGQADLSGLPEELREVVTACLHRDPEQRPTPGELVRALDPAAGERPAAPAPRTGAFPWPDGVRKVITEYEIAVGRALIAPPAPRRAPGPAAAPSPAGSPSVPGSVPDAGPAGMATDAPAARRRRNRLRWAVGTGAGLLVGTVTALLLPLLGDGAGTGADAGASASPGGTGAGGGEAAAVPVVSSKTRDFGPDALDRSRLPAGWSPWSASFEGSGSPLDCALSGTVIVCRLHTEDGNRLWLEARNASDGTALWRYPAEDEPADGTRVDGLDLDARHAYITSADGDGFAILRLDDGEPVATLPGAPGYAPSTARVHKDRILVSYTGGAGTGGAHNMLFRAYALEDRRQLWERVINMAYPASLDVVGDRVWVDGALEAQTLDLATGKTLARVPERCVLAGRGSRHAVCPDGVRDSGTLRQISGFEGSGSMTVSQSGLAVVGGPQRRDGSGYLRAIDLAAGREKWSVTVGRTQAAVVAADRVLVLGDAGARSFELDSGEGEVQRTYADWPKEDGPGATFVTAAPTTVMVSGGALFLTFEDGTLLSVAAP
ncbi:serine/threonine-protein kinase [Streptomyces poriticola]|uniref:serine/threonine-protein kinase n=1 Tax=Streptomyces poriticola TaxID=3120506 RepID=UPI002FCE1955